MIKSDFEELSTRLYDKIGKFDAQSHGQITEQKTEQITEQKNGERKFVAAIQYWLRQLLFGKEKELVDSNYLDLSTFHYPNQNDYLDFIALKAGLIDRQENLTLKQITLLILLLLEFIRIGSQ